MNLILDIGNSRAKVAFFDNNQLLELKTFHNLLLYDIELLLHQYSTTKSCILANTGSVENNLIAFLKTSFPSFIQLTGNTAVPFTNTYESKATQGADRIAAVAGAQLTFPQTDILIIDAGTAITYDFIDTAGNYKGGTISPGLSARFTALHTFTAKLPLLSQSESFNLLATNTEQAIISGVQNGIFFEMDGYIDQLKKTYSQLKTIITGGNAEFFANKLKSTIFVDLNLVLKGLNRILEYNAV